MERPYDTGATLDPAESLIGRDHVRTAHVLTDLYRAGCQAHLVIVRVMLDHRHSGTRGSEQIATVAGVDISGRTTGHTAICVLVGEPGTRPRAEPIVAHGGRDLAPRPAARVIAGICLERGVEVVGIDAPLELPHAVTCDDPSCGRCFPDDGSDASYTTREADLAATWRDVGHSEKPPMPTAMLAAIAFRGIYLRRALERERITTLETWPKGVYRGLAADGGHGAPPPSREHDGYVTWCRDLLSAVVDATWAEHATPDRIDAVAAGYAGWVHETGAPRDCVHVGGIDGMICVPRCSHPR
jgi:predicted nuclease with RNAse H fold